MGVPEVHEDWSPRYRWTALWITEPAYIVKNADWPLPLLGSERLCIRRHSWRVIPGKVWPCRNGLRELWRWWDGVVFEDRGQPIKVTAWERQALFCCSVSTEHRIEERPTGISDFHEVNRPSDDTSIDYRIVVVVVLHYIALVPSLVYCTDCILRRLLQTDYLASLYTNDGCLSGAAWSDRTVRYVAYNSIFPRFNFFRLQPSMLTHRRHVMSEEANLGFLFLLCGLLL
jgi:hypothetical protein